MTGFSPSVSYADSSLIRGSRGGYGVTTEGVKEEKRSGMIDRSLYKATAKRCGDVIVVHVVSRSECAWLNMYLDDAVGQMSCDSSIGHYAYQWRDSSKDSKKNWTDFWCKWLSDEEWLLLRCCGKSTVKKAFDVDTSIKNLRNAFAVLHGGDDCLLERFEDVLDAGAGYITSAEFVAALRTAADDRQINLPGAWWDCLVEDYTRRQRRFAEICREVIVPAIRAMEVA